MKILKEKSVIWLDHNKRLFILLKNGGREPLPEIVQSSFLLKVLCNGGMATELSLLYLLDVGSADLPVDFRHHYRASWLGKLQLEAFLKIPLSFILNVIIKKLLIS